MLDEGQSIGSRQLWKGWSPEVAAVLSRPTADVPVVGKLFFDMGKNASYAAASRGEIPTIRVGRLLRVPTAALRALLRLDTEIEKGA